MGFLQGEQSIKKKLNERNNVWKFPPNIGKEMGQAETGGQMNSIKMNSKKSTQEKL